MPLIQVSGALPTSLRENSRPEEWLADLQLTGDTAKLVAIEITGRSALHFTARWEPGLGTAAIELAAPVDYEAFAAAGLPPQLSFGLRFAFADGSRQTPVATYRVAVLDEDDTPPSDLHFLTGGSVTAGAIGSVIGTLGVTDPDSAGPFSFTFADEDAWRFEVVGTTLKLRDGISLGLDEMPVHALFVSVSDGRQSAGFTLNLTVQDPGMPAPAVSVVAPAAPQAGFVLTEPSQAVSLHAAREVTAILTGAAEFLQLTLAAGGQVWLPAVETVRLADGWVDFAPAGDAARAAALHTAVTGVAADGAALGLLVGQAQAGRGWVDLAAALLPATHAGLADAALVAALYQDSLHRDPSGAELALQLGRLASGVARAQIVADVAGSAAALAAQAEPQGHWVAEALGGDAAWHIGTGGILGGPAAAEPALGSGWML